MPVKTAIYSATLPRIHSSGRILKKQVFPSDKKSFRTNSLSLFCLTPWAVRQHKKSRAFLYIRSSQNNSYPYFFALKQINGSWAAQFIGSDSDKTPSWEIIFHGGWWSAQVWEEVMEFVAALWFICMSVSHIKRTLVPALSLSLWLLCEERINCSALLAAAHH